MYGLSNGENIFDSMWSSKVKDQGQTLKVNISKTVRDREKMSKEVRWEVMYGFSNSENIFGPRWPLKVKGQGQAPKTFMSYISKTIRDREKMSIEVR